MGVNTTERDHDTKKEATICREPVPDPDTAQQLLVTAWPYRGVIQDIIDTLHEAGSNTELRLLGNRLQRLVHAPGSPGVQATTSLISSAPMWPHSASTANARTMVLAGRSGPISTIRRRRMPPSPPKATRSSFMLSIPTWDLFSITK